MRRRTGVHDWTRAPFAAHLCWAASQSKRRSLRHLVILLLVEGWLLPVGLPVRIPISLLPIAGRVPSIPVILHRFLLCILLVLTSHYLCASEKSDQTTEHHQYFLYQSVPVHIICMSSTAGDPQGHIMPCAAGQGCPRHPQKGPFDCHSECCLMHVRGCRPAPMQGASWLPTPPPSWAEHRFHCTQLAAAAPLLSPHPQSPAELPVSASTKHAFLSDAAPLINGGKPR